MQDAIFCFKVILLLLLADAVSEENTVNAYTTDICCVPKEAFTYLTVYQRS